MAGNVAAPLLGRSRELEQLLGAFEEARAGTPRAVALGGDAGMGKTRLVSEVRDRLRDEAAHVLVGGSVDMSGGGLPLAPVAAAIRSSLRTTAATDRIRRSVPAALRPLIPELDDRPERPGATPLESGQLALFGSILRLLHELSDDGPVVLVLEDVHWADDSTRDLVPFLARHLGDVPVLLVVTYRTDELHRQHPLRPTLAELARLPGARTVELAPLDGPQVADLARRLAGTPLPPPLLDDIVDRSQGNPFVVEELVQAHVEGHVGVPTSVSDLLLLRLDAVGPATLALLRLVAVVGRPVPHELLEALVDAAAAAGIDVRLDALAAALREGVERSLLVVDDGAYRFRHALLAEAIDGTLLPGELRSLHRIVAETLTARPELGSATSRMGELAHHWHLAGDVEASMRTALLAADEAERTPAYRESARLVERILEHWDDVEDPVGLTGTGRRELLARAAQLRYLAFDSSGHAVRLCRAALDLVDPDAEPVAAGLLHERLGRYLWVADAPDDEHLAAYERATQLVPADPPTPARARVLAAHGQALMLLKGNQDAVARCREAIRIAETTGAEEWEAHARNTLGTCLCWLGRFDEGLGELRIAQEVSRRLDHADELCRAMGNALECLWLAGHLDDAVALGERAFADVERFGLTAGYGAMMAAGLAQSLVLRGDWDAAMVLVHRHRWPGNAYGARWLGLTGAEIALGRGDVEAARTYVREADEVRVSTDVQTRIRAAVAKARLAVLDADVSSALDRTRRVLDELVDEPDLQQALTGPELLRLLADLPADDRRDELATRAIATAGGALGRLEGQSSPPVSLRLAAATLAVAATPSEGPEGWRRVADLAREGGFAPIEADARLRAVEATLAAGDGEAESDDVGDQLRMAHAIASTLAARPLLDRARVLATRARVSLGDAEDRTVRGDTDLTPRELEVLTLVAEGLTNPEIGRRLYISDKTASVHVSRILRKLGVANRVEAAVAAQRLGLARPPVTS